MKKILIKPAAFRFTLGSYGNALQFLNFLFEAKYYIEQSWVSLFHFCCVELTLAQETSNRNMHMTAERSQLQLENKSGRNSEPSQGLI